MYSVTENYINAVRARTRTEELTGVIMLEDGTQTEIDSSLIESGSVRLTSSCVTGEEIAFGGSIMTSLEMGIKNDLSENAFYNAVIAPVYRILLSGNTWYEVPLGRFTVVEAERNNSFVRVVAYDNLMALEKEYDNTPLSGSPYAVLTQICNACGMTLGNTEAEILAMPNGDKPVIVDETSGSSTYRDCTKVVCQLLAGFAVADRNGRLRVRQYEKKSVVQLDKAHRYSLSVADYVCKYSSVVVYSYSGKHTAVDESIENGLTFLISDAPAWDSDEDSDPQALTDALLTEVKQLIYTPASISMPGDPAIECGDMLNMVTDHGTLTTLVTAYTWTFRGRMDIESVGRNPHLKSSDIKEDMKIVRGRVAKIVVDLQEVSSTLSETAIQVGTLKQQQSELKQTVDNIFLSVSEQVTEEIKNIQIGARNLIRNSTNMIYGDYSFSVAEGSNSLEAYTGTIMDKDDECAKFTIGDISDPFVLANIIKGGEQYTLSFWTKANAEGSITTCGETFPVTSEWQKRKITFKAVGTDVSFTFDSEGVYYIYHPKLETGTVCTDWAPAPEDTGDDIDVVNQDMQILRESVSQLSVNADGITETVSKTEEVVNTLTEDVESVKQEILDIQKESNQLTIDIQKITDDGVNKVTTATGFKFNEVGLEISKSTSDISTKITEDGMTINRNGEALLTADHEGVEAKDLHAKTYLIIGGRSRFENYGSDRTGCFWIGEE